MDGKLAEIRQFLLQAISNSKRSAITLVDILQLHNHPHVTDRIVPFRLPSDQALYDCPEFRPYLLKYADDNEAFFEDYAKAHKKMSELGSQFSPRDGFQIPAD